MIYSKSRKTARRKETVNASVSYFILGVMALIFLLPVLWLFISAFSIEGSMYDYEGFFPSGLSFNNFITLFTDTANGLYDYKSWLVNTLYISTVSCILATILVILTAYTMSRFSFKGRKGMMKTTLVLGMFPGFMGMTAVYIILQQFGLVDRPEALILLYSCQAPVGYMVQKGFFDTISTSIDEAARIDGASNAQVFFKITLPLAKPMLVYTVLTSFAWPWSDFILPKMILKDRSHWTVAVGLMSLGPKEFARFSAGAVLIAVPIVILFFLLVKNMIKGMSAGAVKG